MSGDRHTPVDPLDEVGVLLGESAQRRVRNVRPQADPDELLHRIEVRSRRHRTIAVAVGACLAVAGLAAGVGIAQVRNDDIAAVTPAAAPSSTTVAVSLVPSDPVAARAAVAGAYHDVFTSGVAAAQRADAVQSGFDVDLFARGRDVGLAANLTPDQLAAVTVTTSDIAFVDATHATVTFAIVIPESAIGATPRTGYAVYEGGRWKVAWRTACDVLALVADESSCPTSR